MLPVIVVVHAMLCLLDRSPKRICPMNRPIGRNVGITEYAVVADTFTVVALNADVTRTVFEDGEAELEIIFTGTG